MTSKQTKWDWSKEYQKAVDTNKKLASRETLLSYPNFNNSLIMHTEICKLQLGPVISQDDKPIAFLIIQPLSANYCPWKKLW